MLSRLPRLCLIERLRRCWRKDEMAVFGVSVLLGRLRKRFGVVSTCSAD